jgi:hypothetical protein
MIRAERGWCSGTRRAIGKSRLRLLPPGIIVAFIVAHFLRYHRLRIGNAEPDGRLALTNQQLQKSTNRAPSGVPPGFGTAKERIFAKAPRHHLQKSLNGAALNCV